MRIKSPAFEYGNPIPPTYTCIGENLIPPLEFFDISPDAQSLALIMDDQDGASGTFTHWMVWNISPQTNKIIEGMVPENCEEGFNSSGQKGYMGPCPGVGNHRYFFKLYALNKRLSISSNISKQEFEDEISNSLIDKADFMGTFQKQK